MAFRIDALRRSSFPDTLMALYEKRLGKGEDTIISRSVLARGRLVFCCDAVVQHPNDDAPQAYDSEAWRLCFVVASSRRYLNDRYRGEDGPRFRDRVALVRHYVGGAAVALGRAMQRPTVSGIKYAFGYCAGAGIGLVRSPVAGRLTPGVNWDRDAELSVEGLEWFGGGPA